MSNTKSENREKKNTRALFSVICLCIIALGLVVYFSTQNNDSVVDEQTTIVEQKATEVQHPVTNVTEIVTTTAPEPTQPPTTQPLTMQMYENNTPYKSYYKYPVSESVLKGYSKELVYDETMGDYRAHAAIDFKCEQGDTVVSINDGIVTNVYTDSKYGIVVEIDHGGKLIAKYCGLESVKVSANDSVSMNSPIGTVGKVPCESQQECHLHFETYVDGENVNPLDVMGKTE